MRAHAIASFALWIGAGLLTSADAEAATTQGYSMQTVAKTPARIIQLAGSFQNSNAKLGDKYLAGKAGGRYGIGGTESVVFKKKKH